MSVLVKGVEMPKNCDECPFGDWTDASYFHCFSMHYEYMMDHGERLEDCPLVEVPKPHGRLIDAKALWDESDKYEWYCRDEELSRAFRLIADAPTVIEAEES